MGILHPCPIERAVAHLSIQNQCPPNQEGVRGSIITRHASGFLINLTIMLGYKMATQRCQFDSCLPLWS